MYRLVFAVVILFCSTIRIDTCAVASDPSRPNVVIIYTDDQGYGDASCYNPDSKVQTPSIDALAASGLRFTDAHSADAVCTPSRYALLTGRYCWRTELKRGVLGAEHECLIKPGQATIASYLKSHGYATWMVGKWHLGMDFPGDSHKNRDWTKPTQDMPLDKGFEDYFGIPASLNYGVLAWFDGRMAKVPPTQFTAKKPNKRHLDYRIKPPYQSTFREAVKKLGGTVIEVAEDFVDNQCLTRFTDRAIANIALHTSSDAAEQPFFLYLPLTSPHYPVCPLPEYYGKGAAGGYGEFLLETDYHIGRVVQALEQAGVADNTLIILTSDNGPEKSWKQRVKEFSHRSNGPLREGKRSIYEGGHRVPFICSWPAGIKKPGEVVSKPVSQTDIFATIREIVHSDSAGSATANASGNAATQEDPAELVDSESFLATFSDPSLSQRDSPLIHHGSNGRFAVRSGDWKLVMPRSRGRAELYNLAADLGETRNLADMEPDTVSRLTNQLTEAVLNGRTTAGAAALNDTGHWPDLWWISPERYEAAVQKSAESRLK